MARFRKKPVVVEAEQYRINEPIYSPWVFSAVQAGVITFDGGNALIHTLEGVMTASPGDWIVRGTAGELYPVKPEVFADIYEPVGDDE